MAPSLVLAAALPLLLLLGWSRAQAGPAEAATVTGPGASGVADNATTTGDVYLDEVRDECYASRSALDCLKYKAFKYVLEAAAPGAAPELRLAGGLRVVTMPPPPRAGPEGEGAQREQRERRLLPDAEARAGDSELDKAFRFALRRVEGFVRARALVLELPQPATDGARALDPDAPRVVDADALHDGRAFQEEARGKKKKLALLLPLALFFKLKALLFPILLGVLIIKKMLVVAAVLLPSLLGLVKVCKPAHHHGQAYTLHSADWTSAAGSEYGPPSYGYTAHDSSRRQAHHAAYRAYAPMPGA